MSRDKQIEEIELTEVDMLANDLNQHCADLAETFCGNTNCLTCLAHALTDKGYRRASEVAEEIFAEIAKITSLTHGWNDPIMYAKIDFEKLKELKKKYTEDK